MANTNAEPINFEKLNAADQETTDLGDRVNKMEIESVMTYCSFCGSNNGQPVMALLNGNTWGDNHRMTTADALQIQWKYCRNRLADGFQYKATQDCTTTDMLGFDRSVFNDRICDARGDCPGGDDEGSLASCQVTGTTASGCCSELLFNGEDKCVADQTFGGADAYTCESDPNKIIIKNGATWYRSTTGIPSGQFSADAGQAAVEGSVCPPVGTWTEVGSNQERVRNKHSHPRGSVGINFLPLTLANSRRVDHRP